MYRLSIKLYYIILKQKLIDLSSLEYVARGDAPTPHLPEQFHQLTLIPFSCPRTLTPTVVLADSPPVHPVDAACFLRELSTILS